MLPRCHVLLLIGLTGRHEDALVELEVGCDLAGRDQVTVVNRVERPTHDPDSASGVVVRHLDS